MNKWFLLIIILVIVVTGIAYCGDDVFARNPVTGNLERVWEAPFKPGNSGRELASAVYWSEEVDFGRWSDPEQVSRPGNHSCVNPGIAFDDFGNRYVIYEWQGQFTQIHLRSKSVSAAPNEWSPIIGMSEEGIDYEHPSIVSYKNRIYVSYEGSGLIVLRVFVPDDWDDWELDFSIEYSEPLQRFHRGIDSRDRERLWLSYVYDESTVKFVYENNSEIVGPLDEPLHPEDGDTAVEHALLRIRNRILSGNDY